MAPVDGLGPGGNTSPRRFNSNGSGSCWPPPLVLGEDLFLLVMASKSSKSVEEPWLVGDHGSCLGAGSGGALIVLEPHGSGGVGLA